MPRKKHNLLLQPRLPRTRIRAAASPPAHRSDGHQPLNKGRPRCANAVAGKCQPQQCDQPASLRWVRDRLATAGVTQQPEGER